LVFEFEKTIEQIGHEGYYRVVEKRTRDFLPRMAMPSTTKKLSIPDEMISATNN